MCKTCSKSIIKILEQHQCSFVFIIDIELYFLTGKLLGFGWFKFYTNRFAMLLGYSQRQKSVFNTFSSDRFRLLIALKKYLLLYL